MLQKVAILPSSIPLSPPSSAPPRFLRLPHPRTHQPTLFLPYTPAPSSPDAKTPPKDALLEVQQIRPGAEAERSWFVGEDVVSDGALTLMTPIDPIFLLISMLSAPSLRGTDAFLPLADLWDKVSEVEWVDLYPGGKDPKDSGRVGIELREDVLRFAELECVARRLEECCERKEHDGTILYRFSAAKALSVLRAKMDALAEPNGPQSLFGAYESTQLGEVKPEVEGETPIADVAKPHPTVSRGLAREGCGDGVGLSEAIQRETRQKSAITILGNYLQPSLSLNLLASYTFPLLTTHLAQNSSTTSSVLGSTYLPGRGSSTGTPGGGGGGAGTAAAERDKKRKAESARTSRGVKELANVSKKGMMKLEDMFKRAPAKKVQPSKPDAEEPATKKRKVEEKEKVEGVRKSPRKSKG